MRPYRIIEIETLDPLPTIKLSDDEGGMAVIVRRRGRPVAFWMESLPGGTEVSSEELARRVDREAGAQLVVEALREELAPPVDGANLPSVTIAICTKDRPVHVRRCLESIFQVHPAGGTSAGALDVLVVDNCPSDSATHDVVSTFPSIRYGVEPLAGLNFARNHALSEARGDLIAYLDDDVVVDSGWLAGLAEAHAEHPDAGAFTGLVLPLELNTEAQIIFEARGGFRKGFRKMRYGAHVPGDETYPCGAGVFGTGANMVFRREVLQTLEGFDEALDAGSVLPGGGDLDMFYRIVRAGYPLIYEPSLMVYHEHRRDLQGLRAQYQKSWGMSLMAQIGKIYRHEPDQRRKIRKLVRLWVADEIKLIRDNWRSGPVPVSMIWAELWGGVRGLCGEYGRSVKRTQTLRQMG